MRKGGKTPGDAVRSLRVEANMTQEDLADQLGQGQPFVSKIESGERSIHVGELVPLARALGCEVTTILNRMAGLDSILDRWGISESDLTEMIDENPSLRGMVLGYAAEVKFRRMFLTRDDITSVKDDDHDREKKGDRRLTYDGHELVVEVKSVQTNSCKYDETTNTWTGKSQVDASDKREVKFKDGTTLATTALRRGEFDILAVSCFAFGGEWRFMFALNKDLTLSTWPKYTAAQRAELLATTQAVSWPPVAPFTADWDEILKRACETRLPAPKSRVVDEG